MKTQGAAERDFRIQRVAAPLRQSVMESIRAAIAVGRFEAGQRLPEREVCEMLGVSRTLVREAMRQLETEGLIIVEPHRGPIVARLSLEQAIGVYEVREEMEGLACRLFAQKATEDHREALVKAFEGVKEAFRSDDPIVRVNAKNHFYECLVAGSGNEALGSMLQLLNARAMLLRATSLAAPGRSDASIAELSELVDALMSRDPKVSEAASRRHVKKAAACAIGLMRAQQEAVAD